MLTVLEETVGSHWGNCDGRCSKRIYELRDHTSNHRSCQENLTEALAPYGITGDDIVDIFNLFMNVDLDVDGGFEIKPPTAVKGDHIDLLAEMDILAGISACPSDRAPTNDFRIKPLGVQVLGWRIPRASFIRAANGWHCLANWAFSAPFSRERK